MGNKAYFMVKMETIISCFYTVKLRHGDIHYDHIWMQLVG